MNEKIQQRVKWVKLYQETNNASLVCLLCGISRPTLRNWWSRYQEQGLGGLKGFAEASGTIYPETKVQQCVSHQIRNSI